MLNNNAIAGTVRRKKVANIGLFKEFIILNNESNHSKVPKEKVEAYQGLLGGWRQVRADGNCFYRAVMYEYIEFLICKGSDYVTELIKLLNSKRSYYDLGKEGEEILPLTNKYLSQIAQVSNKTKALSLFFAMVYQNDVFDTNLIRILRTWIANFIYLNTSLTLNGKEIATTISKEQTTVVLKQGEKIKSVAAYVPGLILRMNLHVYLLDDDKLESHERAVIKQCSKSEGLMNFYGDKLDLHEESITILYRPDHYDVLYTRDFLEQNPVVNKYDSEWSFLFNDMPLMTFMKDPENYRPEESMKIYAGANKSKSKHDEAIDAYFFPLMSYRKCSCNLL